MKMKSSLCLLLLFSLGLQTVTSAKESSVELTYESFDEKTTGKTVFIKFYSPTCDHCQELASPWESMAKEWIGHEQGLVGAVDCRQETKFCTEMKIKGLPTLLYGEPVAHGVLLQEYGADQTYEDFSKFANATLTKPMCSPVNLDACEEKDRKRMMYFLSLGTWELGSVINDQEDAIQMARDLFKAGFDTMQSAYDQLGTDHELKKSRIQSKIKMLQGIVEARKTNLLESEL